MRKLKKINSSSFTAALSALEEGEEYTTVAAIYANYRGEHRWHFVTKCGLRVRAGRSLTRVWDKWRRKFADDTGRMDIERTKCMTFTAIRKVRSRGNDDIKCKVVE